MQVRGEREREPRNTFYVSRYKTLVVKPSSELVEMLTGVENGVHVIGVCDGHVRVFQRQLGSHRRRRILAQP